MQVDLHDSKRPLMVIHPPTLTLKEAQLAALITARAAYFSTSPASFSHICDQV